MDNEIALPPSKKRAAGRELSPDDPGLDDEEEVTEQETGTFKKARDEVIESRRIVNVHRNTSSVPSVPTSNPFAGIRLVPPASVSAPVEANNEAKKRAAGRELSQDNPGLDDEEKVTEQETGTFKKASDEVIASRRIVKVCQNTSSVPSVPTSNPFAGIHLVPPASVSAPVEANNEAKASLVERTDEGLDKRDNPNNETNGEGKVIEDEEAKTAKAVVESSKEREKGDGGEKASETTATDEKEAGKGIGKEAETKPADEKEPVHDVKETAEDKPVDEKGPAHDVEEAAEDKLADDQGKADGDKAENKDKPVDEKETAHDVEEAGEDKLADDQGKADGDRAENKDKSVDEKELDHDVEEAAEDKLADDQGKADGYKAENKDKPVDEKEPVHDKPADDQGKADGDKAENKDKPVDEKEPAHDVEEAAEDKLADDRGRADGDKAENKDKKDENSETSALSTFQQLSSTKNAFTGLAGSGSSNTTFSFGSIAKDGSPSGSGFLFGSKPDLPSIPSFGLTTSNNGSAPLFSSITGASTGGKSDFPSMQEVSVETGEENEETVFNADSALYEFSDGGWRERGKGELKVNVSNMGAKKARVVMRARGNYRLILNAYLYPDMKLNGMDKKGISFACVNSASEGNKNGLATFALKFKDGSVVEAFFAAVAAHKGRAGGADDLPAKTPENSPKTADE